MRYTILSSIIIVILLIPSAQAQARPLLPGEKESTVLDSAVKEMLAQQVPDAEVVDAGQVAAEQALGIWAGPRHVRLMLEAEKIPELPEGVEVEMSRSGLHQLRLPRSQVEAVAGLPGVKRLRPPLPHQPAVFTEGLTSANFWPWHASGWRGTGVKIAVIDVGFAGWRDLVSRGELPSFVSIYNARADGEFEEIPPED